jgi:hypothetical protein
MVKCKAGVYTYKQVHVSHRNAIKLLDVLRIDPVDVGV